MSPHVPGAQRLANKVVYRLSAVGQALSGLVCQKKRLTNRVQELSGRRAEPFSEAVKEFVEKTLRCGAEQDSSLEFLQGVRASLTSLREILLECQEIQALLDSITDISDPKIGECASTEVTVGRKKTKLFLRLSFFHFRHSGRALASQSGSEAHLCTAILLHSCLSDQRRQLQAAPEQNVCARKERD